jgi:hypothetical protein
MKDEVIFIPCPPVTFTIMVILTPLETTSAGELRTTHVVAFASQYTYCHLDDVPKLLHMLCDYHNICAHMSSVEFGCRPSVGTLRRTFNLATLFFLYFQTVHPFCRW